MKILALVIFLVVSGCAVFAVDHLENRFGQAQPVLREVSSVDALQVDYWRDVEPILEKQCVVCHGCYDAPCQLKLTAIEGLERGASSTDVYNTTRLVAENLTRLFEDADSVEGWREKGFFPVLNEYGDSVEAHKLASPLYQLLKQKSAYPLPATKVLSDDFTFGLSRKAYCPKPGEMEDYKSSHPLWGMPYALPGLEQDDQNTLLKWLEEGALYTARKPLPAPTLEKIQKWEAFLNRDSLKGQLASRYLFEHLFLANLYFSEFSERQFFHIVRSATAPGEPVQGIATRRPYDDPGVERVYYRLVPVLESIVAKTHMPYALNAERMTNWQTLFFDAKYTVQKLPSYSIEVAANPFNSFKDLPVDSRYRFLLSEAQFTIMNFIKGPVCRGSVALSVIRDRFWVFFIDPDVHQELAVSEFLERNMETLELPNARGDIYMVLNNWRTYSKKERQLIEQKDRFILEKHLSRELLNLDIVWDGDHKNQNAALTIFRHYDSASIEKGLIGDEPKTAWLIGYPLLERIYYLLAAGYDVYGNVGHQLLSRLHMDFLRMEGEANFLMLLPKETRQRERANWYQKADAELMEYLTFPRSETYIDTAINYETDHHKDELFGLLRDHLGSAVAQKRSIEQVADKAVRRQLSRLSEFSGSNTNLLTETTVLEIYDEASDYQEFVTVLRDTEHFNITSMFKEATLLAPAENGITVARGIVGSYPNTYLRVAKAELESFVNRVLALNTAGDYALLLDSYAIRRTNKDFWQHSERVHNRFKQDEPIEFGILDYNRLDNR